MIGLLVEGPLYINCSKVGNKKKLSKAAVSGFDRKAKQCALIVRKKTPSLLTWLMMMWFTIARVLKCLIYKKEETKSSEHMPSMKLVN